MLRLKGEGLSFNDVLVMPAYSEVLPSEVETKTRLTDGFPLKIPLLSAAMDSVTESATAICLGKLGGIGIIHANLSQERQTDEVALVKKEGFAVGAALWIRDDLGIRAHMLVDAGADVLVIDTAHGHSKGVLDAVKWVRAYLPEVQVVGGNVATAEGAIDLAKAGVHAVKVGVGPGSICTTRIVAGVGVPQLTAIAACAEAVKKFGIPVIADGGIEHSGDIVKAIVAGADSVMIGSLFAGTDEAPGEIVERDGRQFKAYWGMGSEKAMKSGAKSRYGNLEESTRPPVAQGVECLVPYRGPLSEIVNQLVGGLCAGMGFAGCRTIQELREEAEFIRITDAGYKESHVHGIEHVKTPTNYNEG